MPLHLLGKKSWNVYGAENIARVRRDEAAAEAAERDAEERMQEEDAARRTAILRGEAPPPLATFEESRSQTPDHNKSHRGQSTLDRTEQKRQRRRWDEDDTDRDIRVARENADAGDAARRRMHESHDRRERVESITGADGHIQLFGQPGRDDASRSTKKRKAEDEISQHGSRLGGYGAGRTGQKGAPDPWYASRVGRSVREQKDAFGRPDPKRSERDDKRVANSDPMAAMKRAQVQLKRAERDRSEWDGQRAAELESLKGHDRGPRDEDRHRRRASGRDRDHHRHHRSSGGERRPSSRDSLEGFRL